MQALLDEHHWPLAMQHACANATGIAKRYFLCDDSGSMCINDGTRLVPEATGGYRTQQCSRWAELCDMMRFVSELSYRGRFPCVFRHMNHPYAYLLGEDHPDEVAAYTALQYMYNHTQPNGSTPICRHLREIATEIALIADQLRTKAECVCIVIATDGESSDGDILDALRAFSNLPVQITIRLCSNERKVIEYWNRVESALEWRLDVLCDFFTEAREVAAVNRWLTYGYPLHQWRCFGTVIFALDQIDEMPLSIDEALTICILLFGRAEIDALANPFLDAAAFSRQLMDLPLAVPERAAKYQTWSSIRDAMVPWVVDDIRGKQTVPPSMGEQCVVFTFAIAAVLFLFAIIGILVVETYTTLTR